MRHPTCSYLIPTDTILCKSSSHWNIIIFVVCFPFHNLYQNLDKNFKDIHCWCQWTKSWLIRTLQTKILEGRQCECRSYIKRFDHEIQAACTLTMGGIMEVFRKPKEITHDRKDVLTKVAQTIANTYGLVVGKELQQSHPFWIWLKMSRNKGVEYR